MFKYMTNPTEIDKHCNGMHILSSKKNINLGMKTVSVTVGADATVDVWFLD